METLFGYSTVKTSVKSLAYSLVLGLLTACGGGGGGGSSSDNSSGSNGGNNVNDEQQELPIDEPTVDTSAKLSITLTRQQGLPAGDIVEPDATRSRDIVVPNGFKLKSENRYNLVVSNVDSSSVVYLSVCGGFIINDEGAYQVNYESCLLRAAINAADYEREITVTNEVTELVAALWFVDSTLEPVFVSWQL